jgi:hypothetical protein
MFTPVFQFIEQIIIELTSGIPRHILEILVAGNIVAVSLLAPVRAEAQLVHSNDLSKAPPTVIEKARMGMSQDLLVILDRRDIEERESQRRAAQGVNANDAALEAETIREFDLLKASVFPNGQLGDARVIQTFKTVPILFVKVPNFNALAAILANQKVVAVEENTSFRPSLQQSLPLISQPVAARSGAPISPSRRCRYGYNKGKISSCQRDSKSACTIGKRYPSRSHRASQASREVGLQLHA